MRHVRLLTRSLEGIHALAYFDSEVMAAWRSVGLKGYWMGYFASRAAPMGRVAAATVEATFPSFAPHLIRRAIPDAWAFASPSDILAARDQAVARVLTTVWADIDDEVIADLARRCRAFAEGIDVPGARSSRPLYAANAAREWPDEPVSVIFHASTLAREYRGDLHMALLAANGIDGIEGNVLAAAGPAYDREWLRQSRAWDDETWQAAVDRLVARDLVTSSGEFTEHGRSWRSQIETRTDELSGAPVAAYGRDRAIELTQDLAPLSAAAIANLPESAPLRR